MCLMLEVAIPSNNHTIKLIFLFSSSESTRLLDAYLFLFDDLLLITKIKRNKKVIIDRDIHGCSCYVF